MTDTAQWPTITSRIIAAVPGGYALSAALVAVVGGLLSAMGLARSDAVVLSAMLGFVLYLLWLLWAFAERRLERLWGALACGLAVCFTLLQLIPAGA